MTRTFYCNELEFFFILFYKTGYLTTGRCPRVKVLGDVKAELISEPTKLKMAKLSGYLRKGMITHSAAWIKMSSVEHSSKHSLF